MKHVRWLTGVGLCALASGAVLASSVLGLSVEDQARLSKWVVAGEVIAMKGVIHEENGIETAVTLQVIDALKGRIGRGDTLVFHTRSGQVGGEVSQAVGDAEIRVGQRVLVFVEEIDGRLYNLGLSMGVWDEVVDRRGGVAFVRALRDGLNVVGDYEVEMGPISVQDLSRRISLAARQAEFDHPMLREALIQGGR